MKENIFSKVPNWLRYILSVPLGLLAVIIVYIIGYWSNLWVASPDSLMMKFFTFIYQNGINVFVLIGTVCYIVPKYQFQFALTISIIFCALAFTGLGMLILLDAITLTYIISFILTFISFIVSCVYTFKIYNFNNNSNESELDAPYPPSNSNNNVLLSIISNPDKLSSIIDGTEQIDENLLLNKQNPYNGETILNYDDIIKYLKMYQLDFNGIDPLSVEENNIPTNKN